MSAPDTNVDKQEERHKPALLGIKGAMLFGVLMLLIIVFLAVMRGGDDEAVPVGANNDATTSDTGAVAVDPVEPGTNESN
ncbi:hypothetical protein BOO69_06385 [Sulfitobacter alexandrii]|uniref:Uncharacterized protein n=1 Tax=Sulfitobacter alexandrii TaxID=1917485 RepID=A0A1J0WFI4_9RHOB|nr:hypothetical protein [Sulfitobacter alexandrii]APE43081.1 hypothetical protein BOO69_06385 [Sulfitobacter alexandrii]